MQTRGFKRFRLVRHALARPRLLISFVIAVVAFFALSWAHMLTRALISWNVFAWSYLLIVSPHMLHSTAETMRRHAIASDESEFFILSMTVFAALASFFGIFLQLAQLKDVHGLLKYLHIGLVISTVISSWVFIQLMFALHYAHEFFIRRDYIDRDSLESKGGLRFPGSPQPDFLDFMYFAFVIGAASATADVEIWSKSIRRLAMVHTFIAYFFNAAIVGLMINIVAGLT